ncbi:hypothetical protein AB3S75_045115 [Citrus x aurantiifolia]
MGDLLGSPRVAPSFYLLSRLTIFSRPTPSLFARVRRFRSPARGLRGTSDPPGGGERAAGGTNCAAGEPGQDGGHGLSIFAVHMVMGATITALMHRIPSEHRS